MHTDRVLRTFIATAIIITVVGDIVIKFFVSYIIILYVTDGSPGGLIAGVTGK